MHTGTIAYAASHDTCQVFALVLRQHGSESRVKVLHNLLLCRSIDLRVVALGQKDQYGLVFEIYFVECCSCGLIAIVGVALVTVVMTDVGCILLLWLYSELTWQ